ncbi:MAG: ATP-dependent zinc metalloprotease FtsH [Oscillospiraceae bacterium]|nr:ATP-dependent zinc metalloprotease FtsH [Oscillospiraceae bacterium]MDD4546114.1 ATP-dependent zinc metalloprotease FtsH [Oscillospiraceae bacterium]
MIIATWLVVDSRTDTEKTIYSDIVSYFEGDKVEKYSLDLGSGALAINLREPFRKDLNKDGKIDDKDLVKYTVPDVNLFLQDIREIVNANNRDEDAKNNIEVDYQPVSELPWIINLLPSLLIIVFFVVMWVMMRRSLSSMDGGKAMGFGKARVKQPADEKRKTTFADVAGADEEKEELREIVDFLKQPKKFKELGARVPKGVLLVGPPGTGKTLLARAVSGEAGVPFFSISGSDFVEMYVGVGASRVRDLFDQAKKNSPCIIFIDEIDAVGRQRGAGLGGGHDEREQTLNQLLVEMDGFGANEGVIMIAATNRPDILDPALMRPGRFDRQIVVNYPDIKGREEILKVHARGKPLAPDVDLSVIAKTTAGFTGADLENLLNEAALLAARKGLHSITMPEIEESAIKVVMGTEKRSHVITDREKKLTAYHEAGHAVVTYFSASQDPVHQVSVIPRGMAGGYTMSLPQTDRSYRLKKEMLEGIQVMMGGRVAEALVLGDISTGASNDIERATETARNMVIKFGMSEKLGPILYGSSDSNEIFLGRDFGHTRNYSEEVAAQIDVEIKSIISACYSETQNKLSNNIEKLHAVAQFLFTNEKMDGDQFKEIMESDTSNAAEIVLPTGTPSIIEDK